MAVKGPWRKIVGATNYKTAGALYPTTVVYVLECGHTARTKFSIPHPVTGKKRCWRCA